MYYIHIIYLDIFIFSNYVTPIEFVTPVQYTIYNKKIYKTIQSAISLNMSFIRHKCNNCSLIGIEVLI